MEVENATPMDQDVGIPGYEFLIQQERLAQQQHHNTPCGTLQPAPPLGHSTLTNATQTPRHTSDTQATTTSQPLVAQPTTNQQQQHPVQQHHSQQPTPLSLLLGQPHRLTPTTTTQDSIPPGQPSPPTQQTQTGDTQRRPHSYNTISPTQPFTPSDPIANSQTTTLASGPPQTPSIQGSQQQPITQSQNPLSWPPHQHLLAQPTPDNNHNDEAVPATTPHISTLPL